jgi:radical SAM protein with 4Fe4S-binding SPASM domain
LIKAEQVRSFLGNRFVQWNLKKLSKKSEDGRMLIDHVFAAYGNQEKVKFKYIPYLFIISFLPVVLKVKRSKLVKAASVPYYRRAISNVAQSVAEFGLKEPQVFSSPVLTVWNFTNACNLSCKHCYQDAHKALLDELSLKERLAVVDELDRNNVTSIAFSGGEPLIHKDFWPVAEYAHQKGIHTSVATNGTLITREVAARLKDVGVEYVEISIDSAKPEVHDDFRGGAGNWLRSAEGIKNCVEVDGLTVGMATTVTRNNYDELDDLIELAKNWKVDSFYVFNFIPAGRGKFIVNDDLTPDMREAVLKKLHETFLAKELFTFSTCPQYGRYCYENAPDNAIINSHYFYFQGQQAKMLADYVGGCGAGRLYCAIQPNGKVSPCVFMPIEVGDLRKEKLADIWRNSEVMLRLRDREAMTEHCGVCEHRSMCGGCRARAYGYFGDYMGPDPGCKYNIRAWEELVKMQEPMDEQEIS